MFKGTPWWLQHENVTQLLFISIFPKPKKKINSVVICIEKTLFSRIFQPKSAHYTRESIFCSGHMPHYIPDRRYLKDSHISRPNLLIHVVTEKYPLLCVFVYNFPNPNLSLFPLSAFYTFFCEHVRVFILNTM